MSLLLDALKKAERVKDEAKRRAQLADGTDPDDTVLQVRTRNELPDISKPLELHSEDITAVNSQAKFSSPVPDAFSTAPAPRPAQEPSPAAPQSESASSASERTGQPRPSRESESAANSAQRAAAKNVFEAKFREPNPKLPFYITLAVLGAFAVGTVVYFWYQLRPSAPLVNTNPKPPPDEKKIEAPPPQLGEKPAAPANQSSPGSIPGLPAVAGPGSTAIRGLPGVPAGGSAAASSATGEPGKAGTVASGPPAKPAVSATPTRGREPTTPSRQQSGVRSSSAAPDSSRLSVNRGVLEVNPKVEAAWLAYNQGDLKAARSHYQEMLRDEPTNRDALLGMAAIEVRANRLEQAALYYQNVLQISPRDPYAQAGLLALRTQLTDPVHTESKVKNLLASDPEAQVLYFSLGNQYSQQERWPEAQQAYFKAYSAEPENPDFAYNLAVSLDHVRQPKLALEYYRRALSLAQQRASNFDQTLARARVQELAK